MSKRGNFRGHGRGRGHGGGRGRGRGGFSGGRGGRGNFRGNNRDRDNHNNHSRHHQRHDNVSLHRPEQFSEKEVGITEYISALEGFNGIIKGRFSDFHVNEIDMQGLVAKLTDTRIPKEFEVVRVEVPEKSPLSEISEEQWKAINEMIDNKEDDSIVVKIECLDDSKEKRSLVHKTLKQIFLNKIVSNTVEEGDKKFIELKRLSQNNKQTRNDEWPQNVPIYTHFLLYKESVDTMNAIMSIGDALRINNAAFNYAGVKDRRAKTTQWISVKKVEPSKLLYRTKRVRNIKIGNICFKDAPLKLGQLQGNQFRVALREVIADDDVINKHLEQVKEHGFINYYGLQRFGNDKDLPTYFIGVKLLQGNFKDACSLILKPRAYDRPLEGLTQAKNVYAETLNAQLAAKKLFKDSGSSLEAKLILGLAKAGKNDYVNALESIPRNMRLMYIHSFQSLVWNKVVSRRVKEYGLKPIIGDLVFVGNGAEETEDNLGDPEAKDLDKELEEKSEEVDDKTAQVKILGEDDLANYTIYDVVLPLPGYNITYPGNALKDYYKELLGKYNLQLEMPMQRVKCYTLSGNYRKILSQAAKLTWHTLNYKDPHDVLIRSDFEEILKHKEPVSDPDGKHKALVLQFCLKSSSYATMVLREIMKIDTSANAQAKLKVVDVEVKERVADGNEEEDEIPEDSLLKDKAKFDELKRLIEEPTDGEVAPITAKRPLDDDDRQSKKPKVDDKEDEGIKIEASLV